MIQNKSSLFLELKKQSNFFHVRQKVIGRKISQLTEDFLKDFKLTRKENFCTKCDTNFGHSSKGFNACVRYSNNTSGIQIQADLEKAVSCWRTLNKNFPFLITITYIDGSRAVVM